MTAEMMVLSYEPRQLQDLAEARANFLGRGDIVAGVRPQVGESWQRSRAHGVDPCRVVRQRFDPELLRRAVEENRALVDASEALLVEAHELLGESPHLLVLADTSGRVLRLLSRPAPSLEAMQVNLFEGASWHERDLGCNGVGTALATGEPVVLIGPEHFQEVYVGWTCIGVPLRWPDGEIAGVLDLSVPNEHVSIHTWGWSLSVVRAMEAQLASAGRYHAPTRGELHEALNDPLSVVRGVLVFLGEQTDMLPSHRAFLDQGLAQLDAARSQLDRMATGLVATRDELVDLERRTSAALAALAHELRNPLGAIAVATELLEQARGLDGTSQRTLGVVRRQLEVLERLAGDLGTVVQMEQGCLRLEKQRVDLRECASRAVEAAAHWIRSRAHVLTTSHGDRPLWVAGDPLRLEQVIVNLLVNAAKYTPPGGRISLTSTREGDEIVLRVADTGAGIPAADLAHIFAPFRRVDSEYADRPAGMGLGLALVRSMVESHGGRVAAASDGPGSGSVFTVWLPAGEPDIAGE